MAGKFSTTSSSLFNNNNKNNVPNWMSDITESLEIKDNHIDIEFNKPRGAFAQFQSVYRPEEDASLRKLAHTFNETKLISDAKIELARFLSGKYYKVKNAIAGTNQVVLEIVIDSVPSQFQFSYEVNNNKLNRTATFFGNEGDYPFSKAGLEECLLDIKTNKVRTSKKVEAVGKTYLINREEIVRRFNGSLRQATDKINSLLNEGLIIGAGSNTYASFYDVDYLFPQMKKEAAEERMPEFHFTPNQEHVATNQHKSGNVLSLEASKILSQNFNDFVINQVVRDGNELLVKATVLGSNNVRQIVDFSFDIVNEKVEGIKVAEINDQRMSLGQLVVQLNSNNKILNQYASQNKVESTKLYNNVVFTRKDIRNRLNKVVSASKIERVVDSWLVKGLINPINSTTFVSNHSFEELLSKTAVANVLSKDEVAAIEAYQRHFGEGLEFTRDEKAILDRVREASDAEISDDAKFTKLQHHLSKFFKNFTISDFNKFDGNSYTANLNFVNQGVRNSVIVVANFNSGVEVVANIGKHETIQKIELSKLAEAFEKSPVLSAYLSESKGHLVAGKTIMSIDSMRRKLAEIVSSAEVESTIKSWLNNNLLVNISENQYVSDHSFEELLQMTNVAAISEDELADRIAHKQRDRGMEVRSSHEKDTGTRKAEDNWSPERMAVYASYQINSIFKDVKLLDVELADNSYSVTARIVNPIDGLKKKLKFTFAMDNGVPRELSKVSDGQNEVNASEIVSLLENTDEAIKQFTEHNTVAKRSYQTVINRGRLESQLLTVANAENVPHIVDALIKDQILQPMNSHEFASSKSVAEIVAHLSALSKTDVEVGKEQMSQAVRSEHRLDLRGQHIKETDSRALEAKELELSPQMKVVQTNLKKAVSLAERAKKITANKSNQLLVTLDAAKTEKDLDLVSKELKRYLQ